jgi:hypothetical protein
MRAFHCIWTAPVCARQSQDGELALDDFQVLTTVLSALKWREFNGSIKLYTDETGAEYVSRLGLTGLWDGGIDTQALAEAKWHHINPGVFWAAGKLLALAEEPSPCVMIDTDFIVWRPLHELAHHPDLVVIHREPLYDGVYLARDHLKTADGYRFSPEWSWDEWACNSALVFFGNDEFRRYYVSESLRFMDGNTEEAREAISQMVFAEQRLLGMCAAARGIEIRELMPRDPQEWQKQDSFTHVWGYKDEMRKDDAKREEFCNHCADRIARDYPYLVPLLTSVPELGYYFGNPGANRASSTSPLEVRYRHRFPYGGYGPFP